MNHNGNSLTNIDFKNDNVTKSPLSSWLQKLTLESSLLTLLKLISHSDSVARILNLDLPSFTAIEYFEEHLATNSNSGASSSPVQDLTDATAIARQSFTTV